jgi:hypothetical protein
MKPNDLEHPMKGLLQNPYPSDWDPDTTLYGPDWRSRSGHTDGWWWATDNATLCGVKDGTKFDEDEADQSPIAAKVVEHLTADLTAPLWAVEPRDFAVIGGQGRLRDWGLFHLDRVADAALWVVGVDGRRVVVAVDPEPLCMRIVGPSGRVAVVMGMNETEGWFPTVDLPVADATTEATR